MKILDHSNVDEWKSARPNFIGASESAAILGHGYANQNALTVFADKVLVLGPYRKENEASRDELTIGRLLEGGLVSVFNAFAGGTQAELEVPFRVRLQDSHEFIGATLDALTLGEAVPVELKNVGVHMQSEWDDGNSPLKYQIQVSHQMLVTGAPKAYLMALVGGNKPVIREIHRNDRFLAVLESKLVEFWGFVQRREVPTDIADWSSDATSDAIRLLHPDDNGETIVIDDPAACEWMTQIAEAKRIKKEAEAKIAEAENQLRAAMGSNTFAVLGNGVTVSLKTQERAAYQCPATKYRVLRVSK